jgi:phosphoribosylaminoimidazole (AIR) synthetase
VRSSGTHQNQYTNVRAQLAKQMTPAQAAEAQQRVREWMQSFDKTKN